MTSTLLREKTVAETLAVQVQTLRNWRFLGKGPAYLKIGKAVRYRPEDIKDFLEKRRIDPNQK